MRIEFLLPITGGEQSDEKMTKDGRNSFRSSNVQKTTLAQKIRYGNLTIDNPFVETNLPLIEVKRGEERSNSG